MNAPPGTFAGSANQPGRPERGQSSAIDQRPVWWTTTTSPISPASIRRRRSAWPDPEQRLPRHAATPAARTASTIRSASASVIAIGLPRMMCLPARAALIVSSGMSATGGAMWTMSMSSRASSSS